MAERSGRSRRFSARRLGLRRTPALALTAALALLGGWIAAPGGGAAASPSYAPLNQPGPPLTVARSQLQQSLYCEPSVRDANVEPVLLNPATGVTPSQNYGWNWEPALNKLRIPWCAYTAPDHTLGNIETSGEYIVYAIRTMYQLSHRKIAILGHSQGGMSMRWALRFWPDTRKLVADVIGIAATNHGTLAGSGYGCDLGCPAGTWQQIVPNEFIPALNSYAETFAGISYTEIYTHEDVVATPNTDRSHCTTCLHTGGGQITDVAVQDICPGDQFEHIGLGTIDPVAYALAVDALTHPGPADPTRIPRSVCSQSTMPGVSSANWDGNLVGLASAIDVLAVVLGPAASLTSGAPLLDAEPPLDCYVTASCQGSLAPTLRIAYRLPRRRHGTRRILDVHVDALEGHRLQPVPQVTVTVAGEKGTTNAGGNVTLTLPARTTRRYRITASRAGCNPASKTVL